MNLPLALRRPSRRAHVLLVCCLTLVTLNTAWWCWLQARGISTSAENGPMEAIQAGCLAYCAVVFSLLCARAGTASERWIYACLAVHSLGFFSREVDLEDFDLPAGLIFVGTGWTRYAFLGVLWLGFLGYFLLRAGECTARLRRWLGSGEGRYMLAAAGLYVLAWPFDRGALSLEATTLVFVEELIETQATLLMLVSASLALLLARSGAAEPGWSDDAPGLGRDAS